MLQRILLAVCFFAFCAAGHAQEQEITNSIGMKLVLIPEGTFQMGSPPNEKGSLDDERQHEVTLTRDYYLGAFEVTQSQYEKVMGKNPSFFQGKNIEQRIPAKINPETGRTIEEAKIFPVDSANHPAEGVSWDDAVEFCKRLSALPDEKTAGRVYRLPTEAEWEYACRAGSKTAFCFGDEPDLLKEYAWFSDISDSKTHPVGEKKPNVWGLYDMHGNVLEWCADIYSEYPKVAVKDPAGSFERSNLRVTRGGYRGSGAIDCRSASRKRSPSGYRFSGLGFRVALSSTEITKK